MSGLTAELLVSCAVGHGVCDARRSSSSQGRIKVHTLSGLQIGLVGVGEEENRLTLPPHFVIEEILKFPRCDWVRFATVEELSECPVPWYRKAPFAPRSFLYADHTHALSVQTIGLEGAIVQAVESATVQTVEEVPCHDLIDVKTPPTPPPRVR